MVLNNLSLIPGKEQIDILLEKDKIRSVLAHTDSPLNISDKLTIEFQNAIVFPGLINSHDHLEFNLFPQLGNRIYNNYVEWGEDIHRQNKDVINSVLKIPKQLCIHWGIYKNLLNGVTTVVNHGSKLPHENNLVTVWQNSHSLHSVANEKKWRCKLNMPFLYANQPVSIHIGEGTDRLSEEEIDTFVKWNLFNRKLIGIHAVAMNEEQAAMFKAVVWCPDSNNFLLGRTAAIDKLKHRTKILFGTDSTVSSNWNLWKHLRLARLQNMVTDNELFTILTTLPAGIWNIQGCGAITEGCDADIVIGKKKTRMQGMDAFFALNPEDIFMVLHKGNIRLFDADMYQQLHNLGMPLDNYYKIYINSSYKYIFGNLPELIKSVKKYYPEAYFPVTS